MSAIPKQSSADIDAERRQNESSLAHHVVVSETEWLKARRVLLEKEKQFSKQHDDLSAQKRALPWVKVAKHYAFTDPNGDLSLSELFGSRSQLFIKHFMMEPDQDWQCAGCTLEASHVDGLLEYFDHHDMSYVAVSRAPIEQIEKVRQRMHWKFRWVSSFKSDFNYDFHVSFRPEEVAAGRATYNFREFDPKGSYALSGNSVFYKDSAGNIFLTYGTFGRGGEQFLGIYGFFDVLPKGRAEYGPAHSLPDWADFKVQGVHNCSLVDRSLRADISTRDGGS
ncbi:MAG TPA: DUF899 family protein [Xanthobacteraceae bacterium]|jgi:predicted dithiol-disulfide oxidoreductase (DUF899 family)